MFDVPDNAGRGFTLVELVIVFVILGLMIGLVSPPIVARLRRTYYNAEVQDFARVLRLAAEEAVLRGKTYVVYIEVYAGDYAVFEVNEDDIYSLDDPEQEPLIHVQRLEQTFIVDAGYELTSGELLLKATPQGWEQAIVITFEDMDRNNLYVRCDKLTTQVTVSRHPLKLVEPMPQVSMDVPL